MKQFNPLISRFTDEAIRKQNLHSILDEDLNAMCHIIHQEPVCLSPESNVKSQLDTTIHFYPSVYDAEKYIRKSQQLLESLHGIQDYVICEIRGCNKGINTSFHASKRDSQLIETALNSYFQKSFLHIKKTRIDSNQYHAFSFTPQTPFYTALTPPEFVLSPLNQIIDILLSLKQKAIFQVLMMPMSEGLHEKIGQAIDADWYSKLPSGNTATPPSVSQGRYSERELYKNPDYKQYYAAVVRFLAKKSTPVIEQKLSAFVSSFTYGQKPLAIYKYDSDRYTSRQIGFVVNTIELSSLAHFPFESLSNLTTRDLIAQTPPGQIPEKKKAKRAQLGIWNVGSVKIPVIEPEARKHPHIHVLGLPRTGKSCCLEDLFHSAIEHDNAAVVVIDGHGDLYDSISNHIKLGHKDRTVLLDFSLDDYVPQISLRDNFTGDYGMAADEISASIKGSVDTSWFGPRMLYITLMLFYAYCVDISLSVADIRILASHSKKGKNLRNKVAEKVQHPIVRHFLLEEMQELTFNQLGPVIARLGRFLIHDKNYRLFSANENKIDIADIINSSENKIMLVNLASGKLGIDRAQTLGSLLICIITSILFARASIPFGKRTKAYIILDEFYLFSTEAIARIIEQASKYNVQLILANQAYSQLSPEMRESIKLVGSRVFFKTSHHDADSISKEMKDVEAQDITDMKPFSAFALIGDNSFKIQTAKPITEMDGSCYQAMLQDSISKYYMKLKPEPEQAAKKLTYGTI